VSGGSDLTPSMTLVVCAAPLATRAPDVATAFVLDGWSVRVAFTPASAPWVDTGALHAITGAPPVSDYRSPDQPKRAPAPELVVVAPLTFNSLNAWASGGSNTYALGVLNEALGSGIATLAVPFINDRLWGHPILSKNIAFLESAGVSMIDASTGSSGCAPVRSGTGPDVSAAFDPAWLLKQTRSGRPRPGT